MELNPGQAFEALREALQLREAELIRKKEDAYMREGRLWDRVENCRGYGYIGLFFLIGLLVLEAHSSLYYAVATAVGLILAYSTKMEFDLRSLADWEKRRDAEILDRWFKLLRSMEESILIRPEVIPRGGLAADIDSLQLEVFLKRDDKERGLFSVTLPLADRRDVGACVQKPRRLLVTTFANAIDEIGRAIGK